MLFKLWKTRKTNGKANGALKSLGKQNDWRFQFSFLKTSSQAGGRTDDSNEDLTSSLRFAFSRCRKQCSCLSAWHSCSSDSQSRFRISFSLFLRFKSWLIRWICCSLESFALDDLSSSSKDEQQHANVAKPSRKQANSFIFRPGFCGKRSDELGTLRF